jgi:hypothetical protein
MKFLFGIVYIGALLIFTSFSAAKPADASHKSVIEKMNLKAFETLQGRFVQEKIISEIGVEIKTEGNFKVSRVSATDSVFHWNVEKPQVSKICLDAKGIVLDSLGGLKKISFDEMGPDSGQQISSLIKLISSDPEQMAKDFSIKEKNTPNEYELTPKDLKKVFFERAEIHVGSNGLMDRIKLIEKSKGKEVADVARDELRIQFSDLKINSLKKIKSCAP